MLNERMDDRRALENNKRLVVVDTWVSEEALQQGHGCMFLPLFCERHAPRLMQTGVIAPVVYTSFRR